mmetsp:Transcript_18479/g.71345  ORF Transcript_18479/g.71345 Transcript_18479/m.71345 type:complete len:447 (-) Transcript_18479:32-1372(-)|eukprot:CAMPEP_0114627986 /NCGR_PEP_ID=MMETSP0168-20121206/12583_1 /TAXON_ID=95228 ORGANISM="Vannella sp., Strain DIVA3 517/6/12" /NCGR_SAMPLE_ID=MMETSP0168 /ASSEMBLY_ACC=CAM_ASM_000044 /LENGTH=446 /DNA_ID=CAMNT_0001839345 /DNA_START=91 /DNA_END=1431 /DNA_ORIENTATION=-
MKSSLLVVMLLVALVAAAVEGKVLMGRMSTEEDFVYIGKFTYDTKGPGLMYFDSNDVAPAGDVELGYVTLNLYNDEPGKPWTWSDVWNNDKLSCQEKVNLQHPISSNKGVIIDGQDLKFEFNEDETTTWFLTVSDCHLDSNAELEMDFHLHFINSGSGWINECSVEDQNMLTIFFLFFALWIVAVPFFFVAIFFVVFKQNKELAYVMKMFLIVVVFMWIALGCYFTHYAVYAIDGIGIPSMQVSADVLYYLAYILFMIILLLSVSKKEKPVDLPIVTWAIAGPLFFLYLVFFLWQEIYVGLHPALQHYRWDVPPGIVMACIQVLIWVYFAAVAVFQAIRHAEFRLFMVVFAAAFTLWFLFLPFMAAVLAMVEIYYRKKWMTGMMWLANTAAFAVFALLAVPSPLSDKLGTSDVFSKPTYNTNIIPDRLVNNQASNEDDEDDPFGGL